MLLRDFLHREAEFEAGAHPLHVGHVAAEDFLREFLATGRRRDRNDRIRVHVVDVFAGQKRVQRRVDRGRPRVEVERRVRKHAHHVVFGLRLEPMILTRRVELLETEEFALVERRKILARAGAQVAAGALDPEHGGLGAGERVLFGDLGRRIAAAGIGDALIASEDIGAVDQAADRIKRRGFGVVPEIVNEVVGGHG
jgi:hypothetical protein